MLYWTVTFNCCSKYNKIITHYYFQDLKNTTPTILIHNKLNPHMAHFTFPIEHETASKVNWYWVGFSVLFIYNEKRQIHI